MRTIYKRINDGRMRDQVASVMLIDRLTKIERKFHAINYRLLLSEQLAIETSFEIGREVRFAINDETYEDLTNEAR